MIVNLVEWVSPPGEEGRQQHVATFTLKDGKVECTDKNLLDYLYKERIRNIEEDKPNEFLTPDDGKLFMVNLKYHFRNPTMLAVEVE